MMQRSISLLVAAGLLAIVLAMVFAAPTSLAQRATPTPTGPPQRATPTPTVPSGGGGKQEPTAPPSLAGTVHGYVYDYSNGGAPQGGIPVILDGGGWRAEAVTNSEGFYEFAGLGSSPATLSLRLPPGTNPVTPNWPVHTGSANPEYTNLAFYWGDTPPMPVVMTVNAPAALPPAEQPFELVVAVNNRSGGVAGEAAVSLQLPAGLTALDAKTSHGQVDFSEHRIWGQLGDLPAGETATLTVKAMFSGPAPTEPLTAEAVFTYREQLTPQLAAVSLTPPEAGQSVAAAIEATPAPPTPAPASAAAEKAATPQAESLIPTTGGKEPAPVPGWPGIVLSAAFIVGLGIAGVRAFTRRAL